MTPTGALFADLQATFAPPPERTIEVASAPPAAPLDADDERGLLIDALKRCGGNKARAARMLGMPRSTYFSKLKKYGIV